MIDGHAVNERFRLITHQRYAARINGHASPDWRSRAIRRDSAETCLTNRIRNDINSRMRALLMAMIAMHEQWDEELGAGPD